MTQRTVIAKGLEGIIVDTSDICLIDGNAGRLIYRGYDIRDLAAHTTFEEICHLLWKGELPRRRELQELTERLVDARPLPRNLQSLIQAFPSDSDPLDVLRSAISVLGTGIALKKPDLEDAINITAKIPTINAMFHRASQGLEPVEPRPDLSHAENYLYMLSGSEPEKQRSDALNKYLISLADHGMNASTFTARIVASTWSDMYSAIDAAIGALKGPLHGGAPAPVLQMVREIGSPDRAESWMLDKLDSGGRLMGFGHRVYRTTDPRADILKEIAGEIADRQLFDLAKHVEATGIRLLRDRHPDYAYTNVEFYSAFVMYSAGLPPSLFTATFAASRSAGWSANVLEQVSNNRLIRPSVEYTGPTNREVIPIERR